MGLLLLCGLFRWGSPSDQFLLIKDLNDSPVGSAPEYIVALGDQMVFATLDVDFGRELFISDGTEAGTTMLKDINPSGENGIPSSGQTGLVLGN